MKSIREIFRIGYGPSSSHTMGPRMAAVLFLERCPSANQYEAHLYGSLSATGKGHLTDAAIIDVIPNVEIIWDSVVEKIVGQDQVEEVVIHNVKSGEKTTVKTDGIFIAVGIHPNTECFAGLVEMDKNGYIVAGENCETSVPGIFVAGDTRTKELRQIITAVADGANAVNSVQKYLLTL